MNITDLLNKDLFVAAATKIASVKLKEMGPGGKALGALAVGSGLYYGGGKAIEGLTAKEKKEKDDPNDKVKEKVAALKTHMLKKLVGAGKGMSRDGLDGALSSALRSAKPGTDDAVAIAKAKWLNRGQGAAKKKFMNHIDNTLAGIKGPGMMGNKARAAV